MPGLNGISSWSTHMIPRVPEWNTCNNLTVQACTVRLLHKHHFLFSMQYSIQIQSLKFRRQGLGHLCMLPQHLWSSLIGSDIVRLGCIPLHSGIPSMDVCLNYCPGNAGNNTGNSNMIGEEIAHKRFQYGNANSEFPEAHRHTPEALDPYHVMVCWKIGISPLQHSSLV